MDLIELQYLDVRRAQRSFQSWTCWPVKYPSTYADAVTTMRRTTKVVVGQAMTYCLECFFWGEVSVRSRSPDSLVRIG